MSNASRNHRTKNEKNDFAAASWLLRKRAAMAPRRHPRTIRGAAALNVVGEMTFSAPYLLNTCCTTQVSKSSYQPCRTSNHDEHLGFVEQLEKRCPCGDRYTSQNRKKNENTFLHPSSLFILSIHFSFLYNVFFCNCFNTFSFF